MMKIPVNIDIFAHKNDIDSNIINGYEYVTFKILMIRVCIALILKVLIMGFYYVDLTRLTKKINIIQY